MADLPRVIEGKIKTTPFETVGRTDSWAEQRTVAAVVIGKYETLASAGVRPGDQVTKYQNWFTGLGFNSNYFIKNFELTSSDGVTGELRMSLVHCPKGKTERYNITWDVGMEEVQMKLINHPMIIEYGNVSALFKWEETRKGRRIKYKSNGEMEFYYDDYGDNGQFLGLVKMTGDWNIAYCKAVTQGIETFNRYLPVITKNTYYLELAGAQPDLNHIIHSGTIRDFTGADSIGRFDAPDLKVQGYIDHKDGVWFKSGDKYTSQADGSWIRTETWVFTNDPRHMWIYTNELD